MVDHNHFDFDFDDDEFISMIKLFDEEGLMQEIELLIFVENEERRHRKPNIIRNRQHTLDFINSWSDEMFKKQFRLCREDFQELLFKMKSNYPGESNNGFDNLERSYKMGRRM